MKKAIAFFTTVSSTRAKYTKNVRIHIEQVVRMERKAVIY